MPPTPSGLVYASIMFAPWKNPLSGVEHHPFANRAADPADRELIHERLFLERASSDDAGERERHRYRLAISANGTISARGVSIGPSASMKRQKTTPKRRPSVSIHFGWAGSR